jgi:hypothetical protein
MTADKEAPQMERDEALKYVDMHAMSDFVGDLNDMTSTQAAYTALAFALREPERARRLMAPIERQLADLAVEGDPDYPAFTAKGIEEFLTHWRGLEAEPFETARTTKAKYDETLPQLREARVQLRALLEAAKAGQPTILADEAFGSGSKGLVN